MLDPFNYALKSDNPVANDGLSVPVTPTAPKTAKPATEKPATEKPASSHSEDVQKMSYDLKRLLGSARKAHLKSDVHEHIEALDIWTDAYIGGLDAARKISESAIGTLTEAQKELSLALEEFLRLEDEGGNVATPEQQSKTDDLARALRRINGLIPVVENTFAGAGPDDPETEGEPEVKPVPMPEGSPDLLPDIPPVDRPEIGPDSKIA